jgi:hypothetical protein
MSGSGCARSIQVCSHDQIATIIGHRSTALSVSQYSSRVRPLRYGTGRNSPLSTIAFSRPASTDSDTPRSSRHSANRLVCLRKARCRISRVHWSPTASSAWPIALGCTCARLAPHLVPTGKT